MATRRKIARNGNEGAVTVTGEVRAVDLDLGTFTLRLDDGVKIPGKFSREQEPVLTEALREHDFRRVSVRGRAEFTPRKRRVKRILSVKNVSVRREDSIPYDKTARPIWDVIQDIMKDVPEEALQRLPVDGAENHDHYIYGMPKKKS